MGSGIGVWGGGRGRVDLHFPSSHSCAVFPGLPLRNFYLCIPGIGAKLHRAADDSSHILLATVKTSVGLGAIEREEYRRWLEP